ncbi:uncharacterized protein LOC144050599 [Vanacampus margaritifer]
MCDCFHLAFPNWHGAPSGTGAGRRLRAPDLGSEDHSACDEPPHFTEGERPRPQGSSPVEEHPETEKYSDSDKEEDDPHNKRGRGKKGKKSGFGCGFDRRSTPKMSKLKEAYSPESGMIVKTAKDGGAEGLVYGGGGKEGIFIKEVVPESPASKSLQLKEGDQLLSATVYFDNVSYQDAIQILEHAQAYKVKLCLKRKPDITETDPLAESDIIPEDETFTPEMREHGKSKRRGDARISWPKFPSLGRGKKSRFARSHSSSEADEQRKLELSPTTSDTESPIKTQDALKGKKRHKMKLPSLTKRGRISSSEDQDTDAPTTCTQEAAELLSPEDLQSPMERRREVHRIEEMTLVESSDSRVTKPLAIQHKVELIAIDSALKTTDLTVALTGLESPTGPLSPGGKKKKKERSELKIKTVGKEKSNKKEAKAKSPKRLKTLGASLEIADQGTVKGDRLEHTTQIEQTSPLKGKGKNKKMILLPKREDIEIPGMEDMSGRTKVKGHHDELPETVQLLIDVDSVKEAVSKLPGYKLPKVDMCGVLIPEEITVIDANAQRISVKTPTKIADSKAKQEAPISKAEDTSTPELSKTSFKLPTIKQGDLPSEEILTVTRMGQITTETTQECEPALNSNESDKKSKTAKIVLPSIGFSKADFRIPDVGMYLTKPNISKPEDEEVKGERTIFLQEEISEGGIKLDAKKHEVETAAVTTAGELEYIDSAESSVERELDGKGSPFQILKFEVSLPKLRAPEIDLSLSKTDGKVKSPDARLGAYNNIPEEKPTGDIAASPIDQEAKERKLKMPQFEFTIPEITRPQLNVNFFKKEVDVKKPEPESEAQLPEALDVDLSPGKAQTSPRKDKTPELLLPGVKLDGHEGKFQMPKLKVKGPDIDFGLHKEGGDAIVPEAKVDTNIDIPGKDLEHREKFKNMKAGVDIKCPDVPKVDLGIVNIGIAEAKMGDREIDTEPLYAEIEHKRGKFKMPKLGISVPKVKGPEIDLSIAKKDVNLREAKAEVKIPSEEKKELSVEDDIKTPKINITAKDTTSPTKFWRPTFKVPKFGVVSPGLSVEEPDGDKHVKIDGFDDKIPEEVLAVSIEPPHTDTDGPSIEMTMTQAEYEEKRSKFKLPTFGFSVPEVKGPSIDFSISKTASEAIPPKVKGEIHLPEVELKETSDTVGIKSPEIDIETNDPEGTPSKFKLPSLKFPKFSLTKQSSKASEVEIVPPDVDISISQGNLEVIKPKVEFEPSEVDVKMYEQDSMFKMPKVTGPDIDISLSKKEGELRFPEAELPSAKVEIEGPKIEAQTSNFEGSPSKFKLPTVKFPKFSLTKQSSKESEVEISHPDVNISIQEGQLQVTQPKVEYQTPEVDVKIDDRASKFKMPRFGIAMPKLKGPNIDINLSKKDGEIKIPEDEVQLTDVDMKLPSAKVEIEGPKIEAQTSGVEGSPSKFKLPAVKFPQFSLTKQSSKESDVEIDLPDVDVSLPEGELELTSPKVEFQPPEVDVDIEEHDGKFKMAKLGISLPKMKGPDVDISLSKKDADIRTPETQVEFTDVEMKLPSAKAKIEGAKIEAQTVGIEGSPSKFKVPALKLPKFGVALPQVNVEMEKHVKVDEVDVKSPELNVECNLPESTELDVKVKKSRFSFPKFSLTKQSSKESEYDIGVPDVEVSIPEGNLEVALPQVEFQPPQIDVNLDEQENKFKMPKFGISMPKVKGPEIDKSLSEQDGELRFPEAEVQLTDVKMKLPLAEVEIECPKIDAQTSNFEGSPSKFKLPTFSFPKFSLTKQSSKESEVETGLPDVDVSIPEGKFEITSPQVEFQPPEVDVNIDGQESKFKMPKFGISMPKMKGPDIDISLSKKDGEIKLPEAEVELPDVDVKLPSVQVDTEAGKIEAQPGSVEGSPSKFKLPTFKLPKLGVALPQVSVDVTGTDTDIKVHGGDIKSPELKFDAKIPDPATDVDVKVKKSRFSFPKFSLTKQSSKDSDVDTDLPDVDVSIPEGKIEITSPQVEFQPPEVDINIDGQESKFKMPKFGISMPKMKGPDIDISLSKKDGEIKLPEAEVELSEIKPPSAKVEIEASKIEAQPGSVEGSPSKFKLPTFKLPKLGVALPQVSVDVTGTDTDIKVHGGDIKSPELKIDAKIPDPATDVDVKVKKSRFSFPKFSLTKQSSKDSDVDTDLPDFDVSIPEGKFEITSPQVEFQPPEVDVNIDGQESKFKMPKFGISMPKIKGPDIDISLSKKDGEIKLPEAEVELPDVDVKLPSVQVDTEAPKIEAQPGSVEGSPSKFKLPTFKLPKLGVALPQVSVDVTGTDTDIKVHGGDLKSPELKIDAKIPDPATDVDVKVKKSRFSFPKFSLTKQSSKDSDFDTDLPDGDVSIPEGKIEITSPQVEFQPPEVDVNIDGQESKFKMPKFGISMPKMKGPDIDISLSKKDGEIKLPEAEVELSNIDVKLPSAKVEIEASKIEAQPGSVEGSPSKFKLPTFKLPKLGVALPQVSVDVTGTDTDIKVHGGDIKSPELKIDAKVPDPATDDVKVKKSRFSFPKFSLTKQSSKDSDVDTDFPDVDVSIPEGKIQITSPQVEFQPPEVDVNIDGQESKFKMPKFGISMPKMKGPDIDISLSKKDGEIKLPEAEVELPDVDVKLPSVQVDTEAPKIEAQPGSVEGSPSKFKLPTFKLPKLGVALPQVSVDVTGTDTDIKVHGGDLKSPELKIDAKIPDPATDVDVKVKKSRFSFPKFSLTKQSSKDSDVDTDLPDVDVSIPEGKIQIISPQVEFQPPEVDVNIDGQESKFKMPKFGISMPKMKGPDIDISLSKKDGEIKLPEAEVELSEIKPPSAKVEIEASKIEAQPGSVEGSPSKFKLPTFKLPKLGVALPQVSVDVTGTDTDIKVHGGDIKSPELKIDAKVPDPATDDVKVKKSRFSFPKFSLTKQSSKDSDVDTDFPDVDVSIPEGKIQITSPQVEFQPPEVDVNIDGQESKFKMPKFGISMPKMKGPDIDISLSKKDGEIKLPEAEVELPDVDVKLPSVQVDTEAPKIEAQPGSVEGSPSKFKLPTFKLPKLGVALPQVSVDVTGTDTDIKVHGGDLKSPELKIDAKIPDPATDVDVKVKKSRFSFPKFSLTKQSSKDSDVDTDLPDVDVSIPEGKIQIISPQVEFQPPEVDVNIDGQESKFKMPKFGISMPKMKGPDIDISLSKKDGEIKLPEAEVELSEIKPPSAKVEIEASKIEAQPGSVEGSPSKFKLPTFKLPKLGVALPQVSVDVTGTDTDIKVHGGDIKSPELKIDAKVPDPATDDVKVKKSRFSFPKFSLTKQSSKDSDVDTDLPDVDVSIPEGKIQIISPQVEFQPPEVDVNIDGQESKFKMPKFGISMPKMKGPDIDISLSKKDGEIKLPEAEVELSEIKPPSAKVEIEASKIEAQPGSVEGSPSKFKLPTFKLPKLGVALPQVSVDVTGTDTDIKVHGGDIKSPELKIDAKVPDPATDDVKVKKSRFSFPKFSLTKQSSKDSDVDTDLPDVDVSIPEGKIEITTPKVEFQPPEVDVNIDGQESKFKMPKFGISMPKMKGPDIDISLSKKDGEIKLPEAEVELPDVDVKLPSVQVDTEAPKIEAQPGSVEGSPSKFKLPTFKLPKLGVALPQVSVDVTGTDTDIKVHGGDLKSPELKIDAKIPDPATDVDVKVKKSRFSFPKFSLTKQSSKDSDFDTDLPDVDVSIPEGKFEITSPQVEFQPPEVDVNIDGQESTFKMPKFGISMPKMKGPDIDISLSKKDGEIKLPEAEVELPDVDVKLPSVQVDTEAPKIEAQPGSVEGSPSKFKLPTFKLPKLGVALPQVSVDVTGTDTDIKVHGGDIKSPELKIDAKIPDPATDVDVKVKKSRFSFPKFSLTKQSSKDSDVDTDLPDVDVSIPEGKIQITSPQVEFQPPEVDVNIDGQESKFKMPKFGISMPKMKGPDIDISLSKKDGEIKLPEAEVELPEIKPPSAKVEIEASKIEAQPGSVEGSPSKFKLPTFKLPKLGVALPQVSVDVTGTDTDIKVHGGDIKSPELKIDAKIPDPATDVDVKVKKSRFSFPKFSLTKQSSKDSDFDTDLPHVDVSIPEGKIEITSPQGEFQPPEVDVNIDGQESKFKMPKFGISMPKMKGPDIDISLSKKDGEIKLPEAEVELPDVDVKLPSVKVEIEAPKIEAQPGSVEGSPSKFKLPTFSFPKFSLAKQSSKESQVDIGLPDVDVSVTEGNLGVTVPQAEFQPEVDVNIENKFKMPKFGISTSKVKGPNIDISVSKKDGDILLPEAKVELTDNVEMKLPSAKIDIADHEIDVQPGSVEGSPSKFKLPTIKFPKLSFTKQSSKESQIEIDLPDVDVSIPEGKLEIASPQVEFQTPEVDVNIDGEESKFKMPKFGISMPKMKGPDIEISKSKKDGEIKLPEAEVELSNIDVKLPSVQVDTEAGKIEAQPGSVEGSPSKFKLPTFKLPKLGVALPQVSVDVTGTDTDIKVHGGDIKSPELKIDAKVPDPATDDVKVKKSRFSFTKFSLTKQSSKDSDVDTDLPDVDVSIPEGKIQITSPQVEFQPPEVDVNIDGQESKFKMPKFGISKPKMKGPDIDISLSKKDEDTTLPQTKVEHVEMKIPSAKLEIEPPKIEAETKSVEGSPSKFKLPTFSFPKFSITKDHKESVGDIVLPDVDVSVPGGKMEITSPQVDFQPPEVDVNIDGQESKFKMPKFGISMPQVKGPDIDLSLSKQDGDITDISLSKKDRGITLPDADLQMTDSEMKLQSAKVEIDAAKIEVKKGSAEGSPSKFKLPSFKLPKFGGSPSKVRVEVPAVDEDTDSHHKELEMPEDEAKLVVSAPSIDIKGLSLEETTKGDELEGSGIKMKPLPDVDAEIKAPDVEVEQLESTISVREAPKIEVDIKLSKGTENADMSPVSPSKFKLPSFKMPKMAFSRQKPAVESVSPGTEYKDNQPEMKTEVNGDGKSPQATPTSFGLVLKNIDTEFDVAKTETGDRHPDTLKEEIESKDKETKQQATKSPERTGWFKFPTFGLSSPSEPAKMPPKNDEKDQKSPSGDRDENMSSTCSVQSSDIFADISSTVTSEYVSLPSSSPTKIMVKYSNQNLPPDLEEMNVVTSTARSELITIEPNLPEKVTILSSEVSSSEETLRLASDKIHVFTSSVQSGPESHHAKLMSTVQSTGEASQMSSSWTVESAQSSRKTVSQKQIVRQTSHESTETFVITKQITKTFVPAEFFANDETASSIQRLRESVHSEKMRFFDGAEK